MNTLGNSTAAFYERSLSQMGDLRKTIERLQTQVATGLRIERGSQDPAAASQLRAIARRERLAASEVTNADTLTRDLEAAAGEIGGVADLLVRARELALTAANGTLPDSARAAIAEELEQLGEELFGHANAVSLTGEPLFAGTAAGPAYTRDAAGVVTYAGNGEIGAVPVLPATEVDRGVTGRDVFEFELNGAQTNTFAVLAGLAQALRGGAADPGAAALAAIDGLDAALDTATRSQTVLGTRAAWVEVIQQNQNDRAITRAEHRSEIGDTDLAASIARLQQTLTALEASQAGFARVSSLSLFNQI